MDSLNQAAISHSTDIFDQNQELTLAYRLVHRDTPGTQSPIIVAIRQNAIVLKNLSMITRAKDLIVT